MKRRAFLTLACAGLLAACAEGIVGCGAGGGRGAQGVPAGEQGVGRQPLPSWTPCPDGVACGHPLPPMQPPAPPVLGPGGR